MVPRIKAAAGRQADVWLASPSLVMLSSLTEPATNDFGVARTPSQSPAPKRPASGLPSGRSAAASGARAANAVAHITLDVIE
ncbi:MAG: hypothetical protein DMF96_24520 [Acidobacteria bacterium]|nr:MAG: hypothetical protein DMF96_24520 [Acidobacteriota bacterium]